MALGISDAIDLTGRIADLVKKGATLEAQERIVELREAVLNAKDDALCLQEENLRLREEASEQDAWNERAKHFELIPMPAGAVVHVSQQGGFKHFACPVCFENRKIHILQDHHNPQGSFQCPSCNVYYPMKGAQYIGVGKAQTE